MATEYGNGKIVNQGLVLSLDAADRNSYPGTGTTWRDMSGLGNTGTLTNGPTFNSGNGGSLVFDGSNDHVSFASTTIGSFNNATFSYGAWFYFDGNSQDGYILGKRNDSPFNQYNMAINNDSQNGGSGTKLTAFANPDQNTGGYMRYDYQLTSVGWYHAIVTINNNVQNLYLNGSSVGNTTNTFSGTTFNITDRPLYIGAFNSNSNPVNFFRGRIAVTFLYSRPLSASEILQNYNANKSRFGL